MHALYLHRQFSLIVARVARQNAAVHRVWRSAGSTVLKTECSPCSGLKTQSCVPDKFLLERPSRREKIEHNNAVW